VEPQVSAGHPGPPRALTRRWAHHFLDPEDGMSPAEAAFNALLAALIILTIATTVFSTLPQMRAHLGLMRAVELVAAAVFALEYAGRLWVVPERLGRRASARDYLRYAASPLPLIDLLVLLALLSPVGWTMGALRGLRLLKLLSVLKLGRYSEGLQLVGQVLRARSGELLTLVLIVLVLIFIAASLLHQVESAAGTKGYESVPAALWWAVVTLTTTGYGDVYPATTPGKVLAGVIMLFGVGMVALPAGIVASGFAEATSRQHDLQGRARRRARLREEGMLALVRYSFPGEQLELPCRGMDEAREALGRWRDAAPGSRTLLHAEGDHVTDLAQAWRAEIVTLEEA